jgi:hypothetical protein
MSLENDRNYDQDFDDIGDDDGASMCGYWSCDLAVSHMTSQLHA